MPNSPKECYIANSLAPKHKTADPKEFLQLPSPIVFPNFRSEDGTISCSRISNLSELRTVRFTPAEE